MRPLDGFQDIGQSTNLCVVDLVKLIGFLVDDQTVFQNACTMNNGFDITQLLPDSSDHLPHCGFVLDIRREVVSLDAEASQGLEGALDLPIGRPVSVCFFDLFRQWGST